MLRRALGRLFGLLAVLAVLSLSVQTAVAMPASAGMSSAMSMDSMPDGAPACDDCDGPADLAGGVCNSVCLAPAVLPPLPNAALPVGRDHASPMLADDAGGVLTSPEPHPPRISSALQA